MKRSFLMLLICAMIFISVFAVSTGSSNPGGAKKEVFLDMTSRIDDISKSGDGGVDETAAVLESIDSEDETAAESISLTDNTDMIDGTGTAEIDDTAIDEANDISEPEASSAMQTDYETESSKVPETEISKFCLSTNDIGDNLLLVNKENMLSTKFVPGSLTNVLSKTGEIKIPARKPGIMLRRDVLNALNDMYAAAYNSGIKDMILSSGYRTYYEQNILYSRKVTTLSRAYDRNTARSKAQSIVALPGASEHQTGMAVDVTTNALSKLADPHVAEFAKTSCGKWLGKNSWKFGYILRYRSEKIQRTGIIYEPWHYRYVGSPHAELIYKNGLCLEEYEGYLKDKTRITYTDFNNNRYEIAYIYLPSSASVLNVEIEKGSTAEVSKISANGYVVTIKKPDSA